MNDITGREDIEILVNRFYDKVIKDAVIGYIFNDIVQVDWPKHLPVMYDFWESTIFYTATYKGNPMLLHKQLNTKVPLTIQHFQQWLKLFTETVDELFSGDKAELIKQRAASIAVMMQIKIVQQ